MASVRSAHRARVWSAPRGRACGALCARPGAALCACASAPSGTSPASSTCQAGAEPVPTLALLRRAGRVDRARQSHRRRVGPGDRHAPADSGSPAPGAGRFARVAGSAVIRGRVRARRRARLCVAREREAQLALRLAQRTPARGRGHHGAPRHAGARRRGGARDLQRPHGELRPDDRGARGRTRRVCAQRRKLVRMRLLDRGRCRRGCATGNARVPHCHFEGDATARPKPRCTTSPTRSRDVDSRCSAGRSARTAALLRNQGVRTVCRGRSIHQSRSAAKKNSLQRAAARKRDARADGSS